VNHFERHLGHVFFVNNLHIYTRGRIHIHSALIRDATGVLALFSDRFPELPDGLNTRLAPAASAHNHYSGIIGHSSALHKVLFLEYYPSCEVALSWVVLNSPR